ncbi:MAG TPA: hypothetical protein VGS58_06780, partial [Candidatus Sulfopaludibacter sp.]|nr:hypothetical protein [Candidatus Sulfopaludibacter sp.]
KPVSVRPVSEFPGAGHAMAMTPFTEGGANLCRYQTHVRARFADPLQEGIDAGALRHHDHTREDPRLNGEVLRSANAQFGPETLWC